MVKIGVVNDDVKKKVKIKKLHKWKMILSSLFFLSNIFHFAHSVNKLCEQFNKRFYSWH